VSAEGAKCFAYVQTYDAKPKRRLFEVLKSQGLQANQQVTFLSDGAEDMRELPLYLSPESEHWLDWFHITMRLTETGQLAKGLATEQAEEPGAAPEEPPEETPEKTGDVDDIGKQLERVKWFLWHGNVPRALETIEGIEDALDLLSHDGESRRKLVKAVREFGCYIEANQTLPQISGIGTGMGRDASRSGDKPSEEGCVAPGLKCSP
jgi:hypothetical protein